MTPVRSVFIGLSPAMTAAMPCASAGVSLLLVPGDSIAARKAGSSPSVALTAAWYAARLAWVGSNR